MLPNVPGHVVEAVGVWWVGFDGSCSFKAILAGVLVGKLSGENIGEPFFAGFGFVAPDVIESVLSSPGCQFPFGFGRESFAGPFAVGLGVFPVHANDGVVVLSFDVGLRSGGMLPVGTFDKAPPLPLRSFAPEFDALVGTRENKSSRLECFRRSLRKVFLGKAALGPGFVTGGVHELAKLRVCDLVNLDEESAHGDLVDRTFLGVVRKVGVFGGATGVGRTLDPNHSFRRLDLVGMKECESEGECQKSFHEAWFPGGDNLTTAMAITKFRPCIDLHQGKVKQIVGGTLNDDGAVENFVSDRSPGWYARQFRDDALEGGHVIQLGPGNKEAAREALAAWPEGLQIGGGINAANAVEWLEAGASAVIVTSWFFDKEGRFLEDRAKELAGLVGPEKVVIDLSCRAVEGGWKVAMNRWQTITEMDVSLETLSALSTYGSEFLIHAADVEGQCRGVDEDLVRLLGQWDGCPVTYAGGVRGLDDLRLIEETSDGRLDATVGSALDLFGGSGVTYDELLAWNAR